LVKQGNSASEKDAPPAAAAGVLRAAELIRAATGTTGALAASEMMAARQLKVLDSMRPAQDVLGLAATQATRAAQIGAFVSPSVMSATTLNPALKSVTDQMSALDRDSALTALAKSAVGIDTSPALKALAVAAGPIANYKFATDHLRPLVAGVDAAGITSTWLAATPNLEISSAATAYGPTLVALDAMRPISALLKGVDRSDGFAKMILGLGATNDAIDRVSGLATANAAVASIASFVKPYELPDVARMTNLTATRALFEMVTPLTRSVDRIGRGWASLGDLVVRGDVELAPLIPNSNRLVTKAYRLDIVASQDDQDEDEELFDTRRDGIDMAAEWLAELSMSLCDRWNGMWDRMNQRGPDWRSQAANSAVELINGLLNRLAPDDDVRDWQVASGKHNNPELYLRKGNKGPTRRLKLFYVGHVYRVSQLTVEGLFMAVPDMIDGVLEGVKHGSTSVEQLEIAVSLIGEVIAILVPNRRR